MEELDSNGKDAKSVVSFTYFHQLMNHFFLSFRLFDSFDLISEEEESSWGPLRRMVYHLRQTFSIMIVEMKQKLKDDFSIFSKKKSTKINSNIPNIQTY